MQSSLPKVSLTTTRKWLIIIVIILASFGSGYFFGFSGYKAKVDSLSKVSISRELPPDKKALDFSLFWNVWDLVASKYYDKTKIVPAKLIYGAIKGMVAAVGDPYTSFFPPSENKVVEENLQGSFDGVGIEIGFKGTQLAVIAPLAGSPAQKAGIKAGDFIVGIKDEAKKVDRGTVGITLPEAVQIIRGPAGSKVTLVILRDGVNNPTTVEIARAKLDVPSAILKFVGKGERIADIRLLKFGSDTDGEWGKAISEVVKHKDLAGVIVDLRNNPGGYLQSAVDIASEFIKAPGVVVIEEQADGSKNEFKVQKTGRLVGTPLIVLVNGGSASASEILAGALRDDVKAKLVGEKTFGKGIIQEPIPLENGAGLHVTTARWLTPSGFWVNEKGLGPDVKVLDDEKTTEDEQLQEAIKLLE